MALRRGIETVYFACRSEAKARIAKEELERATGKSVFKVVFVDVSDVSGGRSAVQSLEPIDALVMNAGGMGDKTPMTLTRDGVTTMFATNVLGHVALPRGPDCVREIAQGSGVCRQ